MNANNMNDLMKLVKNLSNNEQMDLVSKIMEMMRTSESNSSKPESKSASINELVRGHMGQKPDCPYCHAKAKLGYIVKRGFAKNVQRFYCKDCGRTFVSTTNTVFEGSRKEADVWKKFIQMTITGSSLRDCAAECKIAYQTAFTWRHKILNAFKENQKSTVMSGKVEIDEMQIPISFKGNHHKGSFHTKGERFGPCTDAMPRKPFRRGSDNKSMSSKDKACVFCMVEDGNKAFYAAVPGVGFMKPNMLDRTIAQHVSKEDSMILADQYRITAKYLEANNYHYMTLAANVSDNYKDHKPEIREGNHLQHINAMHRHLRRFLAPYCGVATKYLENYVSLFVWIKNVVANKQKKRVQKVSLSRTSTADCYISRKNIEALPAIPECA